jgi:Protein of unknown function (DUF1761)
MPAIPFNALSIVLAAVAIFFLCYIWYVPLFGRVWARELGFTDGGEPQGAALFKALGLTALGALLTAVVLHNSMAVWLPATWGLSAPAPSVSEHAGSAAFFTWLGFVLPVLLRGVAWERKSWRLLGIDAGYQLLALVVAATIIAWR